MRYKSIESNDDAFTVNELFQNIETSHAVVTIDNDGQIMKCFEEAYNKRISEPEISELIDKQNNILENFVELSDDFNYAIDKEAFIKKYGDYYIIGSVPILEPSDLNEGLLSITKILYVITNKEEVIQKYFVKIDDEEDEQEDISTTVNCWLVFDYLYLNCDARALDYFDDFVEDTTITDHNTILGAFPTKDEAMKFVKSRRGKMSSVVKITNGVADLDNEEHYITKNTKEVEYMDV